ncbi:MAG TPA: hypothetical protein VGH38_35935 [Bryobacteraceae bacterium]
MCTQQGSKLVGAGGTGGQSASVALSGDGNTAIVGGPTDFPSGAAWVYTRTNGTWSQQGGKLIGAGEVGGAGQGTSVSLSGDGNTAVVGGPVDNFTGASTAVGAAWVFSRAGGVWTQQGTKLIGTGGVGSMYQGTAVAISGHGNTAIVGGTYNNGSVRAAWVYMRTAGK